MMNWIVYTLCFIAVLAIFIAISIYSVLGRGKSTNRSSKYIVNMFEPDNTAPRLTELIDFHKANVGVKYKID